MSDFQGNTGMNQSLSTVIGSVAQNLQSNVATRFAGNVSMANSFNMNVTMPGAIQAAGQESRNEEPVQKSKGPEAWLQKFDAIMGSEVVQLAIKLGKSFVNLANEVDIINRGIANMASSASESARLSESMMQASNRSRMPYQDFAGNTTQLSAVAGDKFSSPQETIAFSEVFSKMMKVSDTQDKTGAFQQVSQGMAAGTFSSNDLMDLTANVPLVMDSLSSQLGKTKEEILELADQGFISSELIKGAFLNSSNEINEQFAATPLTFSEGFTMIKNVLLSELMPVIEQFNELMASEAAMNFFAMLLPIVVLFGIVLAAVISIIIFLVEAFLTGINFIIEMIVAFITFMAPIINFVVMMIVVGLAIILTVVATVIAIIITLLIVLGMIWLAMNMSVVLSSIASAMAVAAAWLLVNWPILLVIAVLALLVAAMISMGVTISDVIGYVAGIFGALYAYLYNIFATFWNVIAAVVEFFANVWNHPLYAIKKLFATIWNGILGLVASAIDGIIDLINLIPGIDIAASGLVDKVGIKIEEAPDDYWEAPKMTLKDIGATAGEWNNNTTGFIDGMGDSLSGKFDNLMGKFKGNEGNISKNEDLENLLGKNNGQDLTSLGDNGMSGLTGGAMPNYNAGSGMGAMPSFGNNGAVMPSLDDKLGKGKEIGNVGKINEDVSITEEDIKLMRDLAERDFILNYQQLTPSATVNFSSTGNTEQDAKKLLEMMETMVVDASAAQLI